jgi:hypothetical protein
MSIKVMSYVWEHCTVGGTELLCLLAIADFADDKGAAYPSVATLAKKIRMSERNTHYLLGKLIQSGDLEIERGAGPYGCNLYRVQTLQGVQSLQGCKVCSPDIDLGVLAQPTENTENSCDTSQTRGAKFAGVQSLQGVQPTAPKPSLSISKNKYRIRSKEKREKFSLPEWLDPHRDVWDAWVEARTKAKHPPTNWAKELAVTKLERMRDEGHNPRRLLADAAFNNWQSFYPPKEPHA